MKLLKIPGCMALALVLMGVLFRPGVRVIVRDSPLPGIYDPAVVLRCEAQAEAAAEEICRGPARGEYQLIPVLCIQRTQAQDLQLTRVLLESYEGVQRVYTLHVGAQTLGKLTELQEVYRLRMRFPGLSLTITPTYTHADAVEQPEAVLARLENYAKNCTGLF